MNDSASPDISYRFTRVMRLQHAREFDRVFASRVFAADDVLVMHGCRNHSQSTRLGLSIGRAVGNAVTRHRWKRWIREAFRLSRKQLPVGFDLVVRPKRGAHADFDQIAKSLPRLANLIARRSPQEQ